MKQLLEGVRAFQKEVFPDLRSLFQTLASGQAPKTLFITCSDSRINPNLITQSEPGELFIIRNAGNIVPPFGSGISGEAATIEYAVSVLKVSDVVVCGHSKCGAMGGLIQPETVASLPAVRDWLTYAEDARRVLEEEYSHLDSSADRLMAAVEENVLLQLDHLRMYPCIQEAIRERGVQLHGWVYKLESGEVFDYDAGAEAYRPLSEANIEAALQAD